MKLKLARACNVVNTRSTKIIPAVNTFSNSPTYINSTALKFLPVGANLKKKCRGNLFCIRQQIR